MLLRGIKLPAGFDFADCLGGGRGIQLTYGSGKGTFRCEVRHHELMSDPVAHVIAPDGDASLGRFIPKDTMMTRITSTANEPCHVQPLAPAYLYLSAAMPLLHSNLQSRVSNRAATENDISSSSNGRKTGAHSRYRATSSLTFGNKNLRLNLVPSWLALNTVES